MLRTRILIVEDCESDAYFLKVLFGGPAEDFYSIDVAETLQEAKAKISAADYDIIFLDLSLPDSRDYKSTFTELHEFAPKIPIIIVTGMENHIELINELRDLGAVNYITKGEIQASKDRIIYSIKDALDRRLMAMQPELDKERRELFNPMFQRLRQRQGDSDMIGEIIKEKEDSVR